MKFMARNSLFGILLRSRWWISLLVAAALVLVGVAVTPPAYALFPLCGAVPFLVIAAIAAWKQRNQPSPTRVAETAQRLGALPWPDFAGRLQAALKADGCQVKALKGDAADFEVARPGAGRAMMSARRWKAAHTGVEPLQRLQAARAAAGAAEAIYVTLGALSPAARAYADANKIGIMDAETLAQLFRRQPL
jgi:restriction system protein